MKDREEETISREDTRQVNGERREPDREMIESRGDLEATENVQNKREIIFPNPKLFSNQGSFIIPELLVGSKILIAAKKN